MKVVHVLKRIETIDNDIKELRKLEKSIQKDKSFSTPIYLTIEKQIGLLVGERVKLLELQISNPPETLVNEIEGDKKEEVPSNLLKKASGKKQSKPAKKANTSKTAKKTDDEEEPEIIEDVEEFEDLDDAPMIMLTQDHIDKNFDRLKKEADKDFEEENDEERKAEKKDSSGKEDKKLLINRKEESVKLLDIALDKGTIDKKEVSKQKNRVRFFRDNFLGSY